MTDPLRARAEASVREFRATGNRDVLAVLRQDGLRDIAHALMMEHVYADDPDRRAEHTAAVDAWLGQE